MAILSTIHKGYLRLKTVAGYVTILPRTLASLVEMKNGKTVEDAVTELDNKVNKVKILSKDESGIAIDTGHSHVRFGTAVRPTARDESGNRYIKLWSATEIANLLKVPKIEVAIDTGHSHVRFGTAVRPTARDESGNRYIKLWSATEIANLLKVPKIEVHNFDLSIRNGDSISNPVHFYTPEYWNDGIFYVYTWLGNDGNVRVDYRMECPTVEN